MRVLQFLPTLGFGGVARVVLNYYSVLRTRGFTFDFVTHGGPEDFHADLIDSGSRIFYVKPIHEVGLAAYVSRLRQLRLSTYDVVHVHTGHLTGVYGGMIRLMGQRRIVAHAHSSRAVKKWHEPFMPLLRSLARRNSLARLACGVKAGDFCFGRARYSILPNGIDMNVVRAAEGEVDQLLKDRLAGASLVVGHVGRFTYEKNHAFLLEAFRLLLIVEPRAVLVLVGDGPLLEKMRELAVTTGIGESVLFVGVRKDIYSLMRSLDVLVLPSLFEGMPMVAIEAQSVGTPCLVSDVVDRGVDLGLGLVYFLPITSAIAWGTAIQEVAASGNDRPNPEVIQRQFALKRYDLSRACDDLAEIYYEVVRA